MSFKTASTHVKGHHFDSYLSASRDDEGNIHVQAERHPPLSKVMLGRVTFRPDEREGLMRFACDLLEMCESDLPRKGETDANNEAVAEATKVAMAGFDALVDAATSRTELHLVQGFVDYMLLQKRTKTRVKCKPCDGRGFVDVKNYGELARTMVCKNCNGECSVLMDVEEDK